MFTSIWVGTWASLRPGVWKALEPDVNPGFSRQTEPIDYIERQRDSYFKELAHIIVGAGKLKICKTDW